MTGSGGSLAAAAQGGGKFWESSEVMVTDNYVHDNNGAGLWMDTKNVGFLIRGNYISDNSAPGVVYEISYNAAIIGNTFLWKRPPVVARESRLPDWSDLPLEAGSDRRVPTAYASSLEVAKKRVHR